MNLEIFSRLLRQECPHLEGFDSGTFEALHAYGSELLRWNTHIKLTACTNLESLAREHLADAGFMLPDIVSTSATGLDVGAGGGLPGIVLAILRPNITWTLIEPIHKKHAFLRHAVRLLGLKNVSALAERFDEHLQSVDARYDLAVSRACWPPEIWLDHGLQAVKPGGTVLALEGQQPIELPQAATRRPYRRGDKNRAVIRRTRDT